MATRLEHRRTSAATKAPKGDAAAGGPLFGSHLSVAGGMVNAVREAAALKLDAVQVFTKNQQQWRVPKLKPDAAKAWIDGLAEMGWLFPEPGDALKPVGEAPPARTVSHASYLINLASPDDELWNKSIDLMTVEVERCAELRIPLLVHHPGAFTTSDHASGLSRIVAAYEQLFRRTDGAPVVMCLENTVGSGSNLGGPFEDLAELRSRIVEATGRPERVGFCFDTCHAHAAGHDMHGAQAANATLDEFERVCGLANIRCLHLNDSLGVCGSKRDRHEHIGKGTIGLAGFGAVVTRPELAGRPMILETPKGETDKGTPHDTVNVRRLRKLAAGG